MTSIESIEKFSMRIWIDSGGCLHQIQHLPGGRLSVFGVLATVAACSATITFVRGRFARFAFLNLQSLYLATKLPDSQYTGMGVSHAVTSDIKRLKGAYTNERRKTGCYRKSNNSHELYYDNYIESEEVSS